VERWVELSEATLTGSDVSHVTGRNVTESDIIFLRLIFTIVVQNVPLRMTGSNWLPEVTSPGYHVTRNYVTGSDRVRMRNRFPYFFKP
jgi:hypothetical protein